jgi:hypothetical protein
MVFGHVGVMSLLDIKLKAGRSALGKKIRVIDILDKVSFCTEQVNIGFHNPI